MKSKISILALLFIISISAFSQSQAWFVKSSEAKVYAEAHNVPILMVFAGSDWCKPCKVLKADILLNSEFQKYYPSKMAILYLDFPMKAKNKLPELLKKQNELLAEKFNKSGKFPYMVVINTNGKVLGELSYSKQTPEKFIKQFEKLLASQN